MLAIYRREMRSYFTTSTGYVFLAISLALSGFMLGFTTLLMGTSDTSTYFSVMLFMLMIFLPILTMKIFLYFSCIFHKNEVILQPNF